MFLSKLSNVSLSVHRWIVESIELRKWMHGWW
jgi:hypothetical protein